jgi:hypothetical protein
LSIASELLHDPGAAVFAALVAVTVDGVPMTIVGDWQRAWMEVSEVNRLVATSADNPSFQ